MAVSALRNAIALRDPAGTLIVHSDRGSQFRSAAFVRTLKDHGLAGSMGRVGACGDNAAMESFFALLQKNVLDRQRWSTREQLRLAIITWIEKTYHRRRRQRRLGRLTPIEYETINQLAHAADPPTPWSQLKRGQSRMSCLGSVNEFCPELSCRSVSSADACRLSRRGGFRGVRGGRVA